MTDDCLPLPALTLGQIAELFPQFHPVTIARWRNNTTGNALPEPDYVPAENQKRALWAVQTITEWATMRGLSVDGEVLARICQTQKVE